MIRPCARTLYELVAQNGDRRILLAYTDRRTRRMMYRVACEHGERLAALTGTPDITFAKRAGEGATMGTWTIRWTGRTQREATDMGRLPWIGDLNKETAAA